MRAMPSAKRDDCAADSRGVFADYYTEEQFIWFSHSGKEDDRQVFSLLETMFVAYGEKQTGYELKMLSCFISWSIFW